MKRNSNYIPKSAFPQNMLAMELSGGPYMFKLGKKKSSHALNRQCVEL
jgi:hypothetical protein